MDRKGRNKEEIPGSKCSMYGYIYYLLQALKGEPLSSVFSSDRTLISASVAIRCGDKTERATEEGRRTRLEVIKWN